MTNTIKNLEAKVARRDKRIAALTKENLIARGLLREAINKAKMLAQDNKMIANNAAIRASNNRTAADLERLRHADSIIRHIKATTETQSQLIAKYETERKRPL